MVIILILYWSFFIHFIVYVFFLHLGMRWECYLQPSFTTYLKSKTWNFIKKLTRHVVDWKCTLFIEKCLSHNQILFFTSKLKEKSNIRISSYKFSYYFFLYLKKMQMNQQVKGNNTYFLVMLILAEQKKIRKNSLKNRGIWKKNVMEKNLIMNTLNILSH